MLNYLKSELYRAIRSRDFYLITGITSAIILAGNILLFVVASSDADFPYGTVWFSLSNLIASLVFLFLGAGLMVAFLYADDKKNGIFKNAVTQGISRTQLFLGKIFVCIILGLLSMAFILLVYIVSATVLLEGPASVPIQYLLQGVGAALPSVIATIILGAACVTVLNNTTSAIVLWGAIVFGIPLALSAIGQRFDLVADIASWLPSNFLAHEVVINMSGQADFLWNNPFGLMKCMVAGFASILIFLGIGIWRARKVEV